MSAPPHWENGVSGLAGLDQAVISRDLDVPGLDRQQVPRRETSPVGATERSRVIHRRESRTSASYFMSPEGTTENL
jgi:hypothetical protein